MELDNSGELRLRHSKILERMDRDGSPASGKASAGRVFSGTGGGSSCLCEKLWLYLMMSVMFGIISNIVPAEEPETAGAGTSVFERGISGTDSKGI